MNNMYVVWDTVNNGYFPITLDVFSSLSTISAIIVITIKNPVTSVLYLITLFFVVSCYLICTGLGFIGLAYLLVYVGAVSILFLFILMLINIRTSELVSETKNSIPLIVIITIIFVYANLVIFPQNNSYKNYSFPSDKDLDIVTQENWEDTLIVLDHIVSIGNVMYSVYVIWLIIVSTILLIAMVGAIAITVKQKLSQYQTGQYVLNSSFFANLDIVIPELTLRAWVTFHTLGYRIESEYGQIQYFSGVSGYMKIMTKLRNLKKNALL